MKAEPEIRPPGVTLPRLRALLAVAEEGTYAAAGRALGLSHSAVAQHIRDLETGSGTRVLERVSGRLRPTPLGSELCEIACRMLDAEREAARVIGRRDNAGRAHLRVGLGNSMPGMGVIAAVQARHPRLAVTVRSGSHSQIMSAVLRREVDVAVLPDLPPDPRLRSMALLRHPVVALAAQDSPLVSGEEIGLAALARLPLVFRSRGSSTQRVVDRALRLAGLAPEPVLTADSRDALYEAVAAGIGVGFMWRHGTARTARVQRLRVPELGEGVEEMLFALADDRNPLIDLCFRATAEAPEGPAAAAAMRDA